MSGAQPNNESLILPATVTNACFNTSCAGQGGMHRTHADINRGEDYPGEAHCLDVLSSPDHSVQVETGTADRQHVSSDWHEMQDHNTMQMRMERGAVLPEQTTQPLSRESDQLKTLRVDKPSLMKCVKWLKVLRREDFTHLLQYPFTILEEICLDPNNNRQPGKDRLFEQYKSLSIADFRLKITRNLYLFQLGYIIWCENYNVSASWKKYEKTIGSQLLKLVYTYGYGILFITAAISTRWVCSITRRSR